MLTYLFLFKEFVTAILKSLTEVISSVSKMVKSDGWHSSVSKNTLEINSEICSSANSQNWAVWFQRVTLLHCKINAKTHQIIPVQKNRVCAARMVNKKRNKILSLLHRTFPNKYLHCRAVKHSQTAPPHGRSPPRLRLPPAPSLLSPGLFLYNMHLGACV